MSALIAKRCAHDSLPFLRGWQAVEKLNLAVGPTFQSVISGPPDGVDRLESLSHILVQRAASADRSRIRPIWRLGERHRPEESVRHGDKRP